MENLKKVFCFDIDGTLCSLTDGSYNEAKPFKNRITEVNSLYNSGNTIILNTARGWVTGIDWKKITEAQLETWNVKYHELYFNKPAADYYIDDKAVEVNNWINMDKFYE
jgi:hypothetical protein